VKISFPAMATEVVVWCPSAGEAAALAADCRRLVEDIEASLSRFRPGSDVARLTAATGSWTAVGTHAAAVLTAAARLRAATDGLFDPAPGRTLAVDTAAGLARLGRTGSADPAGGVIGPAVGLDLGGIAKGYTADAVVALCRRRGVADVMVSVGSSSIAVAGHGPGGSAENERLTGWTAGQRPTTPTDGAVPGRGRPWRVGIRSPGAADNQILGVLALAAGALSTSGTDRRGNHIIDPRTGRPAASGVVQASVAAASGMTAEAYSTALVVGGVEWAARLAGPGDAAQAILVTADAVLAGADLAGSFRPAPMTGQARPQRRSGSGRPATGR
jgi:thiamine biosynthesis lipoprotein